MTPMAPPSSTRCTNPLPHWLGTLTKGVMSAKMAAVHKVVASLIDRVECSRSMKTVS